MSRIYAIALTSFREAIRDRILFAVLGLGAGLVALAVLCFYRSYFNVVDNPTLIGLFMLVGGVGEGILAVTKALLEAGDLSTRADLTVHGFRSTFRDWAGEATAHPLAKEVVEGDGDRDALV